MNIEYCRIYTVSCIVSFGFCVLVQEISRTESSSSEMAKYGIVDTTTTAGIRILYPDTEWMYYPRRSLVVAR